MPTVPAYWDTPELRLSVTVEDRAERAGAVLVTDLQRLGALPSRGLRSRLLGVG